MYKQAIKNISDRPKWKGLENRWKYTSDQQFKRKL